MDITLTMTMGDNKVVVSQQNIEYLGDYVQLLRNFTHAIGYEYVTTIVAIKDDGSEVYSL